MVVRREHQQAGFRLPDKVPFERRQTGDAWHRNVHHHNIRIALGVHADSAFTVVGFGHHTGPSAFEQHAKAEANHGMVVGKQDALALQGIVHACASTEA